MWENSPDNRAAAAWPVATDSRGWPLRPLSLACDDNSTPVAFVSQPASRWICLSEIAMTIPIFATFRFERLE